MHLVIETGPLLAPVVAALAVAVWALAARAWGRPEWFDPPASEVTERVSVIGTPLARCTCPLGGLHDGLYADDPACPAHGRG
jgi:hypothetical protein